MIRVKVAGSALPELRLAVSPLWDTIGSLSTLALGRASPWPYSDWCRVAERALLRRQGAELLAWTRRLGGPAPAFLTPIPAGPDFGIEQETRQLLEQLSQLPEQTLAELAASAAPWVRLDVSAWMRWLSDAILDYWDAAMAPYWTAMHTALQEDVLLRAHTLAGQGAGAVLSTLDQRVRWTASVLELPAAVPSGVVSCDERLVLVPLIFGRRMTRCVSNGAGRVAVSYQGRGTVVLSRPRPPASLAPDQPARGDRLALLIGRGKAAVLRGLSVPSTTSDLAGALGMSASTVSQHLSTLLAADVVRKRRMGVRVVYALEHAGLALLRHVDGDDAAPM
ncbi:ArsR family transcriptional regulator [Micromonospora rubida]|uniref:ArsR family transcriptional regulator n=1 Tax=Micromonospora rubida TaxID=2697657 RepID=A0ABW7SXV3_9ACTN